MRLSTRNQLEGVITEVNFGTVMATVKLQLTGTDQTITASITKEAALELGLEVGSRATALIKSTEVIIGVE